MLDLPALIVWYLATYADWRTAVALLLVLVVPSAVVVALDAISTSRSR